MAFLRHSSLKPVLGLLTLLLVNPASTDFGSDNGTPRFLWQKVQSRGPMEYNKVELDANGKGKFQFKERQSEDVTVDLQLSPSIVNNLLALFVQADFLNESKDFVSPRKVADMGMKTIRYVTGSQQREISFNYSEDRGIQQIVVFFENLCLQERCLFDMEVALKYDRLGIPKKLDELEKQLNSNRIVAPERFSGILDRIYQDESIINYARMEARKLLARIQKASSR